MPSSRPASLLFECEVTNVPLPFCNFDPHVSPHLSITVSLVMPAEYLLTFASLKNPHNLLFMFATECASKLREGGCSSFDVETTNNEFKI